MSELSYIPVPSISISPAPPGEPVVEPYSPFSTCTTPTFTLEDSFRPQHLTPPPTHAKFPRQLSPLRPRDATIVGKGLERDRFEALLQASRERNAALGSRKAIDLRKEIALKAHKNKQVERRALFLSKVLAPPSPTATFTPKTPPESPAVFHYSLPSPGLVSPLALFESLKEDSGNSARKAWVEQVDFRLPGDIAKEKANARSPSVPSKSTKKVFPSLEQISARLSSQGHGPTSIAANGLVGRTARLPAFLAKRSTANAAQAPAPDITISDERPRLSIGIGRLKMPIRAPKVAKTEESLPVLSPPKSPMSLLPKLQITTLVVPRTMNTSPTELSESNLLALENNSRERKAQDMLNTLKRRTVASVQGFDGHDSAMLKVMQDDQRNAKWKRHSAPADITPLRPRTGFEHAVLSVPGGF